MPKPLTRKNYRNRVRGAIESFHRFGENSPMQKGVFADGAGNGYWEFGDQEAQRWFETALTWYRRGSPEPWTGIAYVHWKLGREEACAEECRRVIEFNRARLEEKTSKGLEGERLFREYEETAVAYLLLKDFVQAAEWAAAGVNRGAGGKRPYVLHAARDLANGILRGERAVFEQGQATLRACIPMWPSGGASRHENLYRYSFALQAEHFPSAGRAESGATD